MEIAVHNLRSYLAGGLTLDQLIEWAERLQSDRPADRWLQQVAADLSNPLLCREEATALVHEHLRTWGERRAEQSR